MSKRLASEQLARFRASAEQYPVGDIAQLLDHVDWQREQFKLVRNLMEKVLSPYTRTDVYWLEQLYKMLEEGGE